MLTYYPEVARVGNLASALSQALAEAGSSLTAYSPVPPEKPIWSPFSEHPDAPGMTVPEAARSECEIEPVRCGSGGVWSRSAFTN
jgi:hypothetical protein